MGAGKSVRMFLVDGTMGGLVSAEIMNWTGYVTAAPRSDLAALLKRDEARKTGIYLLLGDDPANPGSVLAYFGEADDVGKRLKKHGLSEVQGGKDFWDRAVVLTSKDMNLTKAHARYLESRFISLATEARRATLLNGTAPPLIPLPEADISDMDFFVEQARIVLPVLGVNILRTPKLQPTLALSASSPATEPSPVFAIVKPRNGVDATAQEVDGEFTVREGSKARAAWATGDHSYRKLREQMEQNGTLASAAQGGFTVFTHDQVFASPSAAAAVVLGRTANGRLEWKVQGAATSYGDWQESQLDEATGVQD